MILIVIAISIIRLARADGRGGERRQVPNPRDRYPIILVILDFVVVAI